MLHLMRYASFASSGALLCFLQKVLYYVKVRTIRGYDTLALATVYGRLPRLLSFLDARDE